MINLILAALATATPLLPGVSVTPTHKKVSAADVLHFQSATGTALLSVGPDSSVPVTLRNGDGTLVATYRYDGKQWVLDPKAPLASVRTTGH